MPQLHAYPRQGFGTANAQASTRATGERVAEHVLHGTMRLIDISRSTTTGFPVEDVPGLERPGDPSVEIVDGRHL
jgi:hypothetical protein